MIDILIPVLNRPENAERVVRSIREVATLPTTVIFLCSRGDEAEIEACKQTGAIVHLVDGGDHEYARKINAGAHLAYTNTPSDFIFLGADDLRFHPRWDRVAVERYVTTKKPVIGTNDLGNATVMAGEHATHSLVHRSYLEQGTIDEPDKLLHEGYHHNWVDTEFIGTAKHRGAFEFAFESHVEHLHPFWAKGQDDEVYARGRLNYRADGRLYRKRKQLWR